MAEAKTRKNAKIRHFIVGDDDMVRDEAPHIPLGPNSDANEFQANVYFKKPFDRARILFAIYCHVVCLSG